MELSESFKAVFRECLFLMELKNKAYGDSWTRLRYTTILDLVEAKITRIQNLENRSISDELEAQEDSLKDIINYAVFGIIKLRSRVKKPEES